MQSVSSRIWTRVAVFISYDDNHYTTGTSHFMNVLYRGKEEIHSEIKSLLFINQSGTVQQIL